MLVAWWGPVEVNSYTFLEQHHYSQSSIYKHFTIDHDKISPTYDSLKDMFKDIYQSPDTRNVKIAKAILIKTERHIINIKFSELIDFLKLFWKGRGQQIFSIIKFLSLDLF